jgi:hypothetical protein
LNMSDQDLPTPYPNTTPSAWAQSVPSGYRTAGGLLQAPPPSRDGLPDDGRYLLLRRLRRRSCLHRCLNRRSHRQRWSQGSPALTAGCEHLVDLYRGLSIFLLVAALSEKRLHHLAVRGLHILGGALGVRAWISRDKWDREKRIGNGEMSGVGATTWWGEERRGERESGAEGRGVEWSVPLGRGGRCRCRRRRTRRDAGRRRGARRGGRGRGVGVRGGGGAGRGGGGGGVAVGVGAGREEDPHRSARAASATASGTTWAANLRSSRAAGFPLMPPLTGLTGRGGAAVPSGRRRRWPWPPGASRAQPASAWRGPAPHRRRRRRRSRPRAWRRRG